MFAIEYGPQVEDEAWRLDARCRDGAASLTALFFSEQLDDIGRAKAFCRECPVPRRVPRRRARTAGAVGRVGW